ncbi:alkyl/aryl-sulfatase [Halobacteriovorax sp.]|uniref:alkyl/aryl-sulfatase n=1 Tax=Halobacteriovorax sp. TaxID=2020862 RepID=UPI003AF2A7CA
MQSKHLLTPLLLTLIIIGCSRGGSYDFNKESKGASSFTKESNQALYSELDFNDQSDFEDAKRGFIATVQSPIMSKDGTKVVYEPKKFSHLTKGDAPETVNPSLWRQSQLNSINGLFKINEYIYQVRGIDLANVSFVKGRKGWIVIDPLTATETSRAALELINKHVERRPVTAVIFTHSHLDHFGGVYGVANKKDLNSGKVKVYAPVGFTHESVSENVIAGAAMSRRAEYMYARTLDFNIQGPIGTGLGNFVANGEYAIARPTKVIDKDMRLVVDGVPIEFIYTPGAEAPTEMMAYFPRSNALCGAEIITHTMHNIQTLRGAQVRDSLAWSKHIQHALEKYGKADVLFSSHHWPTFGNENVVSFMSTQRDLYKFIHDQTVNRLNQGMTGTELADSIKLNPNIAKEFGNRGYYGSLSHNTRAVYDKYLGFFNGNPAELNPLPQVESAKKTIAYMGGDAKVLDLAVRDFKKGEYRYVAEVLNKLVYAQPENVKAKQLLADTYEQLAYQAENATWRNFYAQGAYELRNGVGSPASATASPAILAEMDTELLLDYLAVRVNGEKAKNKDISIELNVTDKKQRYYISLRNSVLTYSSKAPSKKQRELASSSDNKIEIKHAQLVELAMGAATFKQLNKRDDVSFNGDQNALNELSSSLDIFPKTFNIVTP